KEWGFWPSLTVVDRSKKVPLTCANVPRGVVGCRWLSRTSGENLADFLRTSRPPSAAGHGRLANPSLQVRPARLARQESRRPWMSAGGRHVGGSRAAGVS